jgi:SulP family sulfate permease
LKPEIFNSLKGYSLKKLYNDLFSGLMVAVVALPLSIAFGIQSGISIQAGLISAIIGGILISLFSGTRLSIGGPSTTFVALTLTYVLNPNIGIDGMFLICVFAGIFLLLFGILKLGRFLRFVPYSVTIGFTVGIAISLLIGQLKDFFGLTINGTQISFIDKISSIFTSFNTINIYTLILGALSLLLLFGIPKLTKKVPSSILTLIVITGIALLINYLIPSANILLIKDKYSGIKPSFNFINFNNLKSINILNLIIPGFIIAVLSALEGLMSATVSKTITGYPHNLDHELIGHGLANIGSGLFGGLPVAAVLARTSINIENKAKSPLSGIFHSLYILLIYLFFLPIIEYIPFVVLAAILIRVSINMAKFPVFIHVLKFGVRDFLIALVALTITIIFGVMYGVFVGIAFAYLLNLKEIPKKIEFENTFSSDTIKNYKVIGNINFFNFFELKELIEIKELNTEKVILDMSGVKSLDASAVVRLNRLVKTQNIIKKELVLENLQEDIQIKYNKAF